MAFVAGEAGADRFLVEVGVELVGFLAFVEQTQRFRGDMLLGESEVREHLVARSGCAEGVNADAAAIGSSVALPPGGDAGFDGKARSWPGAHDAIAVRLGL